MFASCYSYQYVMTNGQGLPYMLGNYDGTQALKG